MTDEQRVGIQLAKSVLAALSDLALATTEREAEQASSMYHAACRNWDRWRRPDRRLLPDWSAGAVGAVDYLQHMAIVNL